LRRFARQRPLLTFVLFAYGISWAYWIPLWLRGVVVTPGGATTHFPGLLGPMIAAFVTSALVAGDDGVRALWHKLLHVSRPAPQFWLYALSPLAFLAVALIVAKQANRVPPLGDLYVFSGLPRLPLSVVLILVLLFNGYGEETGWRGFALPRLQERYGPLWGPIVLGLIWAGWHVPSFPVIEGYASMSWPVVIFGFGVGIICGSIVLAEVVDRTGGSVLAASIWHLLYNMSAATLGSRGVVGSISTVCVEVWAMIIVGQRWRAHQAWRAARRATVA